MAKVDVLSDDRGLAACLAQANILEQWSKDFVAKHNIATLDDYIYMVAQKEWEEGVADLLQSVPTLKDNRIILARFRSAYEIGRESLRQAAAPSEKVADPNEPLPDATMKALNADWLKRYALQLDPQVDPSEGLRSRVHREFKKQQMTVLEVKKVRSVINLASPHRQESVSLSDNVHLEFHKEPIVQVRSAVEYYFQLRTLVHAWAWAGNYKMTYEGAQHWMIELSPALAYADGALRDCMEFGGGSLTWLHRNDVLTRGKMSTYVRRGFPAGLALAQALRDSHLEWRSPVPSSGPKESLGAPAKRTQAPSTEEPQRKRQVKSDGFRTISMIKGGRKICKAFNDGRDCSNAKCPDIHGCDVRLPNGQACLAKNHTRLQHESKE